MNTTGVTGDRINAVAAALILTVGLWVFEWLDSRAQESPRFHLSIKSVKG